MAQLLTIAGLALAFLGALALVWGSSAILTAGLFLSPEPKRRRRNQVGTRVGTGSLAVGFALQLLGAIIAI